MYTHKYMYVYIYIILFKKWIQWLGCFVYWFGVFQQGSRSGIHSFLHPPFSAEVFVLAVPSPKCVGRWKARLSVLIYPLLRLPSFLILQVLKGHDDHVITCLQFCGNRIVSGSDDNTLKVWSAVTGKVSTLSYLHLLSKPTFDVRHMFQSTCTPVFTKNSPR